MLGALWAFWEAARIRAAAMEALEDVGGLLSSCDLVDEGL